MVSRAEDLRFRNDLADKVGEDLAERILERMPMTPADDLATKDDLTGVRGELLEKFGELRGEFGKLRADVADAMRTQTWVLSGLVVSGIAAMSGIAAVT